MNPLRSILAAVDAGNRTFAVTGLAGVVVAAGLTGHVPFIGSGTSPVTEVELPAPPAQVPVRTDAPAVPDDGRTRVIVRPLDPSASATAADTPPTADQAVPAADPAAAPDPMAAPDPAAGLAALRTAPEGSTLVIVDGSLALSLPDGTVLPLDMSDPGTEAELPATTTTTGVTENEAPVAPPTTTDPVAEQLRSIPGVVDATPIGDGSYAVTLEHPEVLDGLNLDSTPEEYSALSGDTYERYQYALANDGATMAAVGGTAPVLDADMDVSDIANTRSVGAGVVVAVIDSGVDFTHPDLTDARWDNTDEVCGNGVDDDRNGYIDDCHGWDFGYNDSNPYNSGLDPHGTHVAGIIAARRDGAGVAGVAPEATIMDLNVAIENSSGQTVIPTSGVTAAIYYATANGADVINMSLGSTYGAALTSNYAAQRDAMAYAISRGVTVVVAAGNNGKSLDDGAVYPASHNMPGLLTVGATTAGDTVASFSNSGSGVDAWAPGEVVLSTVPAIDQSFQFMSGTSMASPNVAGAAALVIADDPALTPAQVADILSATSDPTPSLGSRAAGAGRVNAGNALGGAAPDPASEPTVLEVAVSGLASATDAAPVATNVSFRVPDGTFDEDYEWELTVVAHEGSDSFALTDTAVDVNGVTTTPTANGTIALGLSGTGDVALGIPLPAGSYGLLFEAVPTADPSTRLGDAFGVAFGVDPAPAAGGDATTPTTTPTGGGGDSATPTTQPAGSGGVGPSPTTAPPASGGGGGGTPTPTTQPPSSGGGGATTTTPPASGDGATTTTAPRSSDGRGTSTTTPPANPSPSPTTPPTTAPATTLPATTTPPTTAPPTTAPAPPTPVASGVYSVIGVTPHYGPVGRNTTIELLGTFPEPVAVFFGDVEAQAVTQTTNRITVVVPARSTPGSVDIRLTRGSSTVLTVASGFTFQALPTTTTAPPASGGSPGATTPTTSAAPTPTTSPVRSGGGSNSTTTTTTARSGATSTTTGAGGPADPGAGSPPANGRQARGTAGGTPVTLANGRTGVRIEGTDPSRAATRCASTTCSATRG